MDAVLFRSRTEPNAPIVVSPATSASTTHVLSVPELVQACVSTQFVNCSSSTSTTYSNNGVLVTPKIQFVALA